MFCPRCGKRNEEGATYCSSCGSRLPEPDHRAPPGRERRSLRERAARLVGRSRRERLISAVTGVAIVIAIVATLVLTTDGLPGSDDAEDAYLEQADRICVERTRALAMLSEELSGSRRDPGAVAVYGAAGAEVVAGWRSQLEALDAPPDLDGAAEQFDQRIQALEAELTTVAERGRSTGSRAAPPLSEALAKAGARTERGIQALVLEQCARAPLAIP
ncbi:MAG: zinc-ribbon domain-containing protein [Solirubrobacterales bacterium]